MSLASTWSDIGERIGVFSKETAWKIPNSPGIYAWFVPLYLFSTDLEKFLFTVNKIYLFDPVTGSTSASAAGVANFHWESLELDIRRRPRVSIEAKFQDRWNVMASDPAQAEAFKQALMEASILMPPLYVGKADDLQGRYESHVNERDPTANVFHNRFTHFVEKTELLLEVSDLLFVCIRAKPNDHELWGTNKLNWLLEQVMMRLARPPFSIK
jgi:hypothetical protein